MMVKIIEFVVKIIELVVKIIEFMEPVVVYCGQLWQKISGMKKFISIHFNGRNRLVILK